MIIDAHAHFEPRMLDAGAMLQKMDEAGVARVALIPAMNDPLPGTPDALLAVVRTLMRRDWSRPLAEVIHRATLTKEGNLRLGGKVYAIHRQPDNASVARVVEAHPERLMGWIFLNPAAEADPLEELERWRSTPGMIGVKLHPHWHDYPVERLGPVLTRAEELGLPVLIHLGFGPRGAWRGMLERHPRLKMISAHAGFPFYDTLWRHGRDCPNLYVDLSSPYINEALARDAVRVLGPQRCIYGTDAPYGFHDAEDTYDYRAIKGWVERMPVSSAEAEAILAGNFAALLDG